MRSTSLRTKYGSVYKGRNRLVTGNLRDKYIELTTKRIKDAAHQEEQH